MKKYCLLVLIALICSCGGGKPFEKRIDTVLGSPDFRGFKLGDSYNKVMNDENSKYLQFPDSNILKYRYTVSDTEEYHWAYIFEEDKIRQIQFDAYLGDPSDGIIYCKKVQKRYKKNWGEPKETNGVLSWEKDGKKIDLINEGPVVSMGKVKLLLYYKGDTTIQNYIPEL
jgi:hypothetical protein